MTSLSNLWKEIVSRAFERFDAAEETRCPSHRRGEDPAFATAATAVTALGAKLSIADGLAEEGEKQSFLEAFQPSKAAQKDINRLFDLAKQTTDGFESYAIRLAKRYKHCPDLLEDVLEGLIYIAASDGALSIEEDDYLKKVSHHFGIKASDFARLKASYVEDENDPYVILGIDYAADFDAVRQARLSKLKHYHPDRIMAEGLPKAYDVIYTQQTMRINEAYEQLKKQFGHS